MTRETNIATSTKNGAGPCILTNDVRTQQLTRQCLKSAPKLQISVESQEVV